jgi:catechol 2,3-dioxygenase-like lactoylglutathione lyase family enzyme
MTLVLNHTIVPVHNKEASAQFFAHLFGLKVEAPISHFAVVRVNDTLTLDFDDREVFEPHHYAFHVSEREFDEIFARVKEAGLSYSSDPFAQDIGHINHRRGGRGFYFRDPNGHILELLTRA